MSPAAAQQVVRLAMRQEGDWWVAYYALPDTMEGAVELGRIQMALVQECQRRGFFMTIMRNAVDDIIREATGIAPSWPADPRAAPEHERGGRA